MLLSLQQLNRAHLHVMKELQSLGLWSSRLEKVDVWLVPFSWNCYGWQNYGSDGSICVPALSGARLRDWLRSRAGVSLRDVLRHEWAHALAHHHHGLVAGASFVRAFDGGHDDEDAFVYDPEVHVSAYAASGPMEDFAENFMLFVKHRGKLAGSRKTPAVAKRWRFVDRLRGRLG